jgi:hypothetical protein
MTLPFRRRHNDAEASHDRARSLIATGFLEPVEPADATWLEAHLAGCADCRRDAAAYEADRELLRSLRDHVPEPPRDLWARTAAEIERSQGQRGRGASAGRAGRPVRLGRVPLGVMSGVLVVLVVIGASLAPRGGLPSPDRTDTARSSGVAATPITVDADALAWIQLSPDGSYELYQASVNEVCVDPRDGCALLNTRNTTHLQLNEAPQSVLFSQDRSQIVVVTRSHAQAGADIVVVSVPTAAPSGTPSSAPASGTPGTSSPSPSGSSVPPSAPTETPVVSPGDTASQPPVPTGSALPPEGHAIVTGVIVVGDAAYSVDGTWLAFSARPADQTTGPDLYTWHVGDEKAVAVTADHRTFFAGWLGNRIIANRVGPALVPTSPDASTDPSAVPAVSTPPAAPTAGPTGSTDPAPPVEEHPVAFILDPTTSARTPLGGIDMWHPTVDPDGKSVVYWAGTLVPDGTGTGWSLGTGHLVLDGWVADEPSSSADPSAAPGKPAATQADTSATADPDASVAPTAVAIGPAGHPVTLTDESVSEFDASFDLSGTRLALWIANPADTTVGTLRLVVLDAETRLIDESADPLPGVAALRGISIRPGRLAWVTPPGQDGQGSHVQVLAWSGREFGQVRTVQGDGFFVAR